MTSQWIPITERLPECDDYILISFENFSLPDIGRYEVDSEGNGTFYPGDMDYSYLSIGIIVNAWQPLPASYNPEEDQDDVRPEMKGIMRRFTEVK